MRTDLCKLLIRHRGAKARQDRPWGCRLGEHAREGTTIRGPGDEVDHVTIENTERQLTPRQVAEMFRVDPKTVTRGASSGRVVHPHSRRSPPVPGDGDPGVARRGNDARVLDRLTAPPPGAEPGPRPAPGHGRVGVFVVG